MEIIGIILTWLVITIIIDTYLMTFPRPVFKKGEYPVEYHIEQKNRIDIQSKYECAAYSTAYVLRHFGINSNSSELYLNFPSKMKSGFVYPKGIRTSLRQNGLKTKYFKGNIKTLKYHISKGNPVIVFIKVGKESNYLHFVPVIGYDEEYLYLAESIGQLANCNGFYYNRKVPIDEFKKLWNIKSLRIPFYSNTFITTFKK